tara:strand:- start:121 stop:1320 length:1200 start_codon:yes stop_codon:yes gene_type:complete
MKQIPLFKVFMSPDASPAVQKVLDSGYIGEGPKVLEFETALKSEFYCNQTPASQDIITCNSATSAEHLIYHMLKDPMYLETSYYWGGDVKKWEGFNRHNSVVLTTPLTCTATNWPILLNGLQLQWVDVDPNTMNMDLDDLETKISYNTRVITVVHWGGYPIDMNRLKIIVNRAEQKWGTTILIIEDCAHAFGSKYKGEYVGFQGNLSTFSTQAIKHITSVDGGFIGSPYLRLNERAKLLRWYGIDRSGDRKDFRCESDIPEPGFKFHMNDVNATVGIENLKHADWIVGKHQDNAKYYNEELQGVDGVELLENKEGFDSAYWLYTIKVKRRDKFMEKMNDAGIMVSRVHERNDKHSCVSKYKVELPKLESIVDEMICIPVGWWVTQEDREYIVDCIKKGW